MAVYIYKAVTRDGQIVRNRVDELNKYTLMKKLKENKLLPISVTSVNTRLNKQNIKKRKKNVETSDSVLKSVREQELMRRSQTRTERLKARTKEILFAGQKVKYRDIMIFTQNFFLLKKANFNNIHALSTIIETTEHPTLKAVIEDILLGVEARRKHVYNYGILYRYIPTYICKYDKSWRIIWVINKSIGASS